jgi:1,4-alpha-glucan branching enzyme
MSERSETPAVFPPDKAEIEALVRGAHGDPFHILGMHGSEPGHLTVRAFVPGANAVEVTDRKSGRRVAELRQLHDGGFFAGSVPRRKNRFPYRLRAHFGDASHDMEDPYRFPPVLGELDLHLMAEGAHRQIYRRLGAHPSQMEGVDGVSFAVWAPNAQRVSVVGDFNQWDGRWHPMRKRHEVGVWELFIPGVERGALYKYEIIDSGGQRLPLKADPLAFEQERPPATSSRVHGLVEHDWQDGEWLQHRGAALDASAPISIYEVHAGSWRHSAEGESLTYQWNIWEYQQEQIYYHG